MKRWKAIFWGGGLSSSILLIAILSLPTIGISGCNSNITFRNETYCPNSDSAWAAADTVPIGCCPVSDSAWKKVNYASAACCVYFKERCSSSPTSLVLVFTPNNETSIVFKRRQNFLFDRVRDPVLAEELLREHRRFSP